MSSLKSKYAFNVINQDSDLIIAYFGSASRVYTMADRPKSMSKKTLELFKRDFNCDFVKKKELNKIDLGYDILYFRV